MKHPEGGEHKGDSASAKSGNSLKLRELAEEMEAELQSRYRQATETNKELQRTVRTLRETQKLFDAFMSHLPAAAWMKDMNGRYVFANAETERLFSTPVADLLGKRSEEVFPTDVAQQFFDIDRRVLKNGGNVTPIEVVQQSGEEDRHLLVSKFVIRGSGGDPEFIAGVAIDTTETKKLEEEIQRLASFPLVNPNPVIELDLEGNVTFYNPAADSLVSACGSDTGSNPFIPENIREIIDDLLQQKSPQYIREVEIDGKFFEEVITALPQHRSVRCYTLDITKRKRAELEREQLLLQLQAVLENINEGVVISDPGGNILAMNKEALALHGFTDVEEVKRHFSHFEEMFELVTTKGEHLPLNDWPIMRALRGERFFDYEVRVFDKSTGRGWVASYNGTPISTSSGDTFLAVVSIRDITVRKELEEQITRLNADLAARVTELEQANQELEAFNRMVSHDLRQPLNTISTSCQAIEMLCDVDDQCKRYVDIANNKVLVMNGLIDSLLKFSRSTHAELKREPVDLSELARKVFTDIRVSEPGRNVTFNVAEHAIANGDPALLRSVLENLIGNAWKYTAMREDAVIEFGASNIDGTETFFVRDNGAGFEPSDGETLFTPFKRLAGAEKFRGFGIGLATVDRIIRRHGGRVCADAEPGRGATFYFTVPAEEG